MRSWVFGLGLVVGVVGFLAFRPDNLFLDDPVEESLSDEGGVPTTFLNLGPFQGNVGGRTTSSAPTSTRLATAPCWCRASASRCLSRWHPSPKADLGTR